MKSENAFKKSLITHSVSSSAVLLIIHYRTIPGRDQLFFSKDPWMGLRIYALTAPEVMPSIYSRELNENISRSGTVAITNPAIMAP